MGRHLSFGWGWEIQVTPNNFVLSSVPLVLNTGQFYSMKTLGPLENNLSQNQWFLIDTIM